MPGRWKTRRFVLHLGLAFVVVAAVALLLLFMFRERLTNALLFYPEKGQTSSPSAIELEFEELWITANDGVRTHGWWIPGPEGAPVILMFHGNAGTISGRLMFAKGLHQLGVTVYMAEYRGYGNSEGSPSEVGLYADAKAALDEARTRAGAAPVIIFGRSLGGAVAIDLAASVQVDGLIAESTFTSLPDMAQTMPIPFASRLVAYEFASLRKIPEVSAPSLIIHGDADELVPYSMGKALHAAAADAAFHSVPGGTHNDTWVRGGDGYWRVMASFLERVTR
jgi:fermentation-respiration switch protein FrsA (DUF1100 family)